GHAVGNLLPRIRPCRSRRRQAIAHEQRAREGAVLAAAAARRGAEEVYEGGSRGKTRGDRTAVRADLETLGPARRSPPESLGRPAGNADAWRQKLSRPDLAARARRQTPAQAQRPAGDRR